MKKLLVPISVAVLVGLLPLSDAGADEPETLRLFRTHYEAIRLALLEENVEGVAEPAEAIHEHAEALVAEFDAPSAGVSAEQSGECLDLMAKIAEASLRLSVATDLGSARQAFGQLSEPMVGYREMAPDTSWNVVYCPMVEKTWLQPEGEIGNPYLGAEMPRCGQVR